MKFLLDNPFILVILVGIISSFYKQVKGANSDDGKGKKEIPKQKPAQPVGRNKPVRGQMKPNKQVRPQDTQRRNPSFNELESTVKLEDLYSSTRIQAEKSMSSVQERITDSPISPLMNQVENIQSIKKKSLEMDQERLIDGLIWSEVLGPPRSRRSHRSSRKA